MASKSDHKISLKRKISQGELTVAVMGRAAAGKTAIVNQYIHKYFVDRYMVTVGNKYTKMIEEDGRHVELRIIDTPGGYCFEYGRKQAIVNADVFILVYSVDNILSFQNVFELRDTIMEKRGEDMPMVIVQTKIDLPEGKWFQDVGVLHKNIPSGWGYPHFCVSAKTGSDMSSIFHEAVKVCVDLCKQKRKERKASATAAIEEVLKDEQIWCH